MLDVLLGLVVFCLFEEEGGNDTGVCIEMLLVLCAFCIYVSWICCYGWWCFDCLRRRGQ